MRSRLASARARRRVVGALSVFAIAGCSSDASSPAQAVAIAYVGNPSLSAVVNQAVAPAPQFEIQDADGNALRGMSFTVAVTGGGGSIVGTPAKTTTGSTTIGTWTLGTTAGVNSMTVSSGSLTPLVINATGTPGVAATSASGGGPLTAGGTVGTAAVISPSIKVMDAFGNAIPNVGVTATVLGGGSVQNLNPTTNAAGVAFTGAWTLGTAAGNQSVTLQAVGAPLVTFTVNAAAGPPASSVANSATSGTGTPGTVAAFQPAIRVLDGFGNPIVGLVVATTVSAGGALQFSAPATNSLGIATVGNWSLAPSAGDNTVTMTAGSLAAVTFSVTTTGSAAVNAVTIVAGQYQTGAPSSGLVTAPVFRVLDATSAPIQGLNVQFQAFSGGSVVSTNVLTDVQGDASPGTWTLGSGFGAQRLTATAGGVTSTLYATSLAPASGSYNLEIRYIGTPPSPAVQAVFNAAVTRVQAQIVRDLPQLTVTNLDISPCIDNGPVVNEVIDDLIVYVAIVPIDGVNGILGGAGPCWPIPGNSRLPAIGVMELDVADVNELLADGQLGFTVLHELHHILGFGTWWQSFSGGPLIQGVGTNPSYLGAAGNAAYFSAGGTSQLGLRIEDMGGPGTANSHWRESLFINEMLTGALDPPPTPSPLSAFSIMSLADFGYSVSTAGADPYTIPAGALRSSLVPLAPTQLREVLIVPTGVAVLPNGTTQPVTNRQKPSSR